MLTSSDGSAAQVPVITAIPAGATIGTFTITTSQTIFARTAIISAIYGGLTRRVSLTVNPVGTATLSGLSISPDHVTGGIATQGTVTLTAPAGAVGFTVALRSSALSAAQVPVALTVPPGQSSATFTITTTSVAAAQTVTITATSGIMIKTATLTVQ
jgi:hypothetical protein